MCSDGSDDVSTRMSGVWATGGLCLFAAQVSFNLGLRTHAVCMVWERGCMLVQSKVWAFGSSGVHVQSRPPYLYIGCLLARGLEVGHRSSRRILVLRSSCSS